MTTDALVLRMLARSGAYAPEAPPTELVRPCFAAEACSEIGLENDGLSRRTSFARWLILAIRLRSFLP